MGPLETLPVTNAVIKFYAGKGHAKSDGNTNFTSLDDISWLIEVTKPDRPDIYCDGNYLDDRFPSSSVVALIFCTSVWLNILILIYTVLNIRKIYSWIEESHNTIKICTRQVLV